MSAPVLEVTDLSKHFPTRGAGGRRAPIRAVDGVSLTIGEREMVGLVGESGSGKSTVGKCIARLTEPTSGTITLLGTDVSRLSRARMRPLRRDVHMVFQDPYSSLNPRMTVGDIVAEPLRQHREGDARTRRATVAQTLERVGLRAAMADRYPHELSGGQRQRVAIARALILRPKLVIADEPVSALDVSVQAAILNLLRELQDELGFSCLFITHDLSVVEFISDRIAVMYMGRIVETSTRAELFERPQHPYTRALLSAAPVPDPAVARTREQIVLAGDPPSQSNPGPGCRFRSRCPVAVDRCATDDPALLPSAGAAHLTACHLVTAEGAPAL